MQKNKWIFLLVLIVSIGHVNSVQAVALKALCSKIALNKTFGICRKIGYVGALCGIGYSVMRYLNDLRNSSRNAHIEYAQDPRQRTPTLNVNTNGPTIIQGQDEEQGTTIHTERIDPDKLHHNLFEENQVPAQAPGNRWQRFWRWFLRPTHRTFVRHIISVPRTVNIILRTTNGHIFDRPDERAIDIIGIRGTIDAQTDSGDIHITNPGGNVTVTTPDHVEILGFERELNIHDARSGHAVRLEGNNGLFTIDDQRRDLQADYRWPRQIH